MKLFGRKRYEARQRADEERRHELYRLGLPAGRVAFENCSNPPPRPEDDGSAAAAFLIGVWQGYESAKWEFEDECCEVLDNLGRAAVREAERFCREAV